MIKNDVLIPTKEEKDTASAMIQKSIDSDNGHIRTLDNERDFMENLLNQRLNFLLLIFTVLLTIGLSSNLKLASVFIFLIGTIVCYYLARTVNRAHYKHHWIMRIFYDLPEGKYYDKNNPHPIKFINDAMDVPDRKSKTKGSVSKIIGRHIPNMTWIIMLLCFLFYTYSFFKDRYVNNYNSNQGEMTFVDSNGQIVKKNGEVFITEDKDKYDIVIIDTAQKIYRTKIPKALLKK
jgi:hypothetical protein